MARPKGTKYIETPEKMWQLFTEYKDHVKKNPITVKDWVGGMGKLVSRPKERPLTIEGFENYVEDLGLITDLGKYFSNDGGNYEDYRTICSRIRRNIKDDQISGGMAGIYNPSITQRLNGLADNTNVNAKVETITIVEN
jgi:hypothetical protein